MYIIFYLFNYLFISLFNIMHKDTINYNLVHSKIKSMHYLLRLDAQIYATT